MRLAFSTRALAAEPSASRILQWAERLDARDVHLAPPVARPRSLHAALRAGGVGVCSVAVAEAADEPRFEDALARAIQTAAATRAQAVVVEGGRRGPDREAATDRLVRALHGPVRAGAPLVLRNRFEADGLLGLEELGWVRSELPELGFWFDPLAAHLVAEQDGAALVTWLDQVAGTVGGVFVHGAGSDRRGGSHPTDGGPPWGTLVAALPRRVPWVLDLGPGLDVRDAEDAARYLRSLAP